MSSPAPDRRPWWPRLPEKAADWELTSNFISRPLAAWLLYPVRATASPNLVTVASLFAGLAGAGLLAMHALSPSAGVVGAALGLLFLAMILDDGDGQLARFQGRSSRFGSFLDKSVDVVRFGLLFPLLSWLAGSQTGDWIHGMAGPLAAFGLMIQGYSKWLAVAMQPLSVAPQPLAFAAQPQAAQPQASQPLASQPQAAQPQAGHPWVSGMLVALLWPFHECDLTVWVVVLGAFGQWVPLVWILAASQLLAGFAALFARLWQVRADERRTPAA